jgi:methylmalonyl-CoA/ethylmalonyl-CoA epimerase
LGGTGKPLVAKHEVLASATQLRNYFLFPRGSGGKMIKRIDHVAIAVKDLEKAKRFFIDVLGGKELFSFPFEPQKFRWTTIELGSSCFIELLDSLEDGGFVHRFLENKGEGMNHITIQVDDIHEIRDHLENSNVETFGFSEEIPGWKEIFVHPKNAFGTLLQFAEFNPLDWINKGYIPESYRELIPAEQSAKTEVEVTPLETPEGSLVEIKQGGNTITLTPEGVKDLINKLGQ